MDTKDAHYWETLRPFATGDAQVSGLNAIIETNGNKRAAARLLDKGHQGFMRLLKRIEAKAEAGNGNQAPPRDESPPQEPEDEFRLTAWNPDGRMMDIDEYCEFYALPRSDIHSYKLVSHTGTPYYNVLFKECVIGEGGLDEDVIERVIDAQIKKAGVSKPKKKKVASIKKGGFDRLIYTDVHIGMEPDENGFALYKGSWGVADIERTIDTLVAEVSAQKQGETLYVDELGDYVDGWDGETTRKGHKLPQNLDNEGQFDVGVDMKMRLIRGLLEHYPRIVCHNVCNDNHAGAFGYVINSTVKRLAEQLYPGRVEVHNQRKFISHYIADRHCFILTHGKDSKHLKFGFKASPDPRALEKIEEYIKTHGIYQDADKIEFSKGDSHQTVFDMAASDDFDYMSYPALSPSSEWVKTNFKQGRRGFVIQHFHRGRKVVSPVFL